MDQKAEMRSDKNNVNNKMVEDLKLYFLRQEKCSWSMEEMKIKDRNISLVNKYFEKQRVAGNHQNNKTLFRIEFSYIHFQ